ncbi:glycoside hydrolase family 127 protein [Pelagicoccus mobilis]|uniref:Glycoside hydrolase family 127 protein n=1 Tax=Pelagicoccus mobilis TaxID=415221 RepID=A0A934RT92_9BACT|nr:beta-L-arabinofuranosidase domain-containing protein [Pelagicoccus mobilis]MBK1875966.1 glycoside hydrolase family 127 protein [Pelagicoccus mobilis]
MKLSLFVTLGLILSQVVAAQEHGIADNAESPHVKLRSINIGDCVWTEGFWADKFKLAEEVMVPHMGEILKGDIGGAYNNFKIAAGLQEGEHFGTNWHDGDFYKWMEAATYIYAVNKDPKILADLDEIIEVIATAQESDGYLHTKNQIKGIERFSNRQLHEMYNAGHLFYAACIHNRVTGQSNFLDIAIKHADFLYKTFVPCPPELARIGFNQTNIIGLVELYRTTKDKRYLTLAQHFIDNRGVNKNDGTEAVSHHTKGDMAQDRTPFRKEKHAEGHAVLGMYLYSGAADVYAETGEKALLRSLDHIWHDVVDRKMYVTGAIGQTHHGASSHVDFVHEAFIDEYMMPNATAYNETCANVCNAMFNWRMMGLKGESKYGDIIELVLYNSALSGISSEGTHYFYTNPLRRTASQHLGKTDYATRTPYIPCFCCPPNLVRTIAKLSGWAYSLSDNGVAVNLYGGNKLDTKLLDGSPIKLKQDSRYPWNGSVRIEIEDCKAEAFDVQLRVPQWANGATLKVNGKKVKAVVEPGQFAVLKRKWKKGDVIKLELPIETKLLAGHQRIEEVRNQVAIKRGPVVYCLETSDLPKGTGVLDVYLPADLELDAEYKADFLGGMTTLSGQALLDTSDKSDRMYYEFRKPALEAIETKFIPYFAWSNRGECEMSVWLPLAWDR